MGLMQRMEEEISNHEKCEDGCLLYSVLTDAKSEIERLQKGLIEIEHHSTDKNAAATARAALALIPG